MPLFCDPAEGDGPKRPPAGPLMDKLIARKVFGWRLLAMTEGLRPLNPLHAVPQVCPPGQPWGIYDILPYSTDRKCTELVVAKLKEFGWALSLSRVEIGDGEYADEATFATQTVQHVGLGYTQEDAICWAALAAIEEAQK